MAWKKKVVWSEGMFLRPQHFQQFERYLETVVHDRALGAQGCFWGFHSLKLDQEALALGRVSLQEAHGLLPDGTPFSFPGVVVAPPALDFPKDLREERVILALPLRRMGTTEVDFEDSKQSLARYKVIENETGDSNSLGGEAAPIQLGDLRLRLFPESKLSEGWVGIGVIRVIERRADNSLVMDASYIPPTLSSNEQLALKGCITEVLSLVHQRGDAIASRMSQPGRGGIGEVSDFLLLQLINRYEPLLKHLSEIGSLHPERLFSLFVEMAGELSTFSADTRRPRAFLSYDHDDLSRCFASVMLELRRSLSTVLEQNAFQIELHERSYGVRVALIKDAELIHNASFVLAVYADSPAEIVRARFPTQVKIGPVEKIRDLVNLHLPGVTLQALPIAPRQIPYNAGYNYFELDTTNELWRNLEKSGGLAMHIAGDFPGLALEFWAIRN
jgi:type VI secretion system protein ImpJ